MKLIIKIAKNELRNLLYSPVAWFIIIVFLVMCGYFYTSIIYPLSKGFSAVLKEHPDWVYRATESATESIFSDRDRGFFVNVLAYLYLFVPLLTMGVVNREFNSGTIKLLYSSPIKLRQVVWGKYVALMIYNLVFVGIIGIFIASGFFDIKSLDYGPLLSALFGIYLFLCALTAIGFFMSSLTAYPIVSAIASFTVLFILTKIGGLWQQYDFVRDITYFLSVKNRTEKMVVGLVRTKDIVYYLVIIYMFVSFTLLKLKGGCENRPWYIKAGRYAAITAIGLLTGYIGSRPGFTGYLDTTRRNVNTIHPRTQKILQELGDSTLEVIFYTNLLDFSPSAQLGFPKNRNTYLDTWEPYIRFKPGIKFKYEYYYNTIPGDSSLYKRFPGKTLKQIAGLIAKGMQVDSSLFKSPEEMGKTIDLAPENYNSMMQVKYRGRTAFLRDFNAGAALKRVLGTKMPKIAFVTGELERNIYKKGEREYWLHTLGKATLNDVLTSRSLINMGFDVDTLNLATQNIPTDITTVVLADPKTDLSSVVAEKLKSYIDAGGNMLMLGEPGKQYVLNPLLKQLGIQLVNGQLVQPDPNETPDNIATNATLTYPLMAEEHWSLYARHLLAHHISINGLIMSGFHGVTAVFHFADSGFIIKPLFTTLPGKAWLKAGKLVTDSTAPVFDPKQGDIKEDSFPVAVLLSRQLKNKEQRIIVLGDADIASNRMQGGDEIVRSFYSWLSYNQFPIYIPIPYAKDNIVVLKPGWASGQRIVYVWVLPGILLVLGTVLLVRRKRK